MCLTSHQNHTNRIQAVVSGVACPLFVLAFVSFSHSRMTHGVSLCVVVCVEQSTMDHFRISVRLYSEKQTSAYTSESSINPTESHTQTCEYPAICYDQNRVMSHENLIKDRYMRSSKYIDNSRTISAMNSSPIYATSDLAVSPRSSLGYHPPSL